MLGEWYDYPGYQSSSRKEVLFIWYSAWVRENDLILFSLWGRKRHPSTGEHEGYRIPGSLSKCMVVTGHPPGHWITGQFPVTFDADTLEHVYSFVFMCTNIWLGFCIGLRKLCRLLMANKDLRWKIMSALFISKSPVKWPWRQAGIRRTFTNTSRPCFPSLRNRDEANPKLLWLIKQTSSESVEHGLDKPVWVNVSRANCIYGQRLQGFCKVPEYWYSSWRWLQGIWGTCNSHEQRISGIHMNRDFWNSAMFFLFFCFLFFVFCFLRQGFSV